MESAPFAPTVLANFFGGWEVVLFLAVILIFFGARRLPDLMRGLGKGVDESKKATDEVSHEIRNAVDGTDQPKPAAEPPPKSKPMNSSFALWIAQGFGVGRIPFAPGTFGSLVGFLWLFLLLATGNFWLFLAGILAGVGLSVWFCGAAEKILRQKDPSSVVLDEIIAIPICFLPWVASEWFRHGLLPGPEAFLASRTWYLSAIIFALFRVFDILKPWPVGQSQSLPGGWGVTVDDVLAAVYVALLTLVAVL